MPQTRIVTINDLLDFVYVLSESTALKTDRPLQKYLRALWGLIQEHRLDPVSPALLANLLLGAFDADPLPFDDHWFDRTSPPGDVPQNDGYGYLRGMILYQIADLQRMQGMEISPAERFGGVKSPTGHTWYNLHPASYLECAVAGFRGHIRRFERGLSTPIGCNPTFSDCGWITLAEILYLGQIYE